jgi:hypothetical protein
MDDVQRSQPQRRTRRWFLVSGAAVLVGAGGGVAADLAQHRRRPRQRPVAPAELRAAVAAERALVADLDATTGGGAQVRALLTQLRADHAAHLSALTGLVATYGAAGASAGASASAAPPAPGVARSVAQLRAAEQQASAAAADRAARLAGAHAALLASIAACEASHADLLR